MTTFYTNVQSVGNQILYRGVRDGQRIKERVDYEPSLYIPSQRNANFKSLEGIPLMQKRFDNLSGAREYIKRFDDVAGAPKVYGQTRFEYAYIADEHANMVDWEQEHISIGIIDIEVGSENGFPDPYEANEPITARPPAFAGPRPGPSKTSFRHEKATMPKLHPSDRVGWWVLIRGKQHQQMAHRGQLQAV